MEWLTIALSALLGLLSPPGLIIETLSEGALRDRFASVETLRVRIDNAPTHQILQGKIDRLRFAGRGLVWMAKMKDIEVPVRIELLELETDRIDVDRSRLEEGIPAALDRPLQAGVRLVLTEADINRSLQAWSQGEADGIDIGRYQLHDPQIDCLAGDRLHVQVEVQEAGNPDRVQVVFESGFRVQQSRYIELIQPVLLVNGEAVPPELIEAFFGGSSQRIDLDRVLPHGAIGRLLKFEIASEQLELAVLLQIE
jgi:non-ribosomal peptide synthetase component F